MIRQAGAERVLADALEAAWVEAAVRTAQPEVVVHEIAALPAAIHAAALPQGWRDSVMSQDDVEVVKRRLGRGTENLREARYKR